MRQAVKVALVAATFIAPTAALSATITVHTPDGDGRVFVDVVGKITDEDFQIFKVKTDQIYPFGAGYPKKQMIVTLISYGGSINSALQIGELIRKRGMYTFVPGDRTCASACALIWLAGKPRLVGDTPQIGFHAAFDPATRRETGQGNAVVGAYLRDLGLSYKAIVFMTRKGPTSVEWLSPDLANEFGVVWAMLQPSRAIPIPAQPKLQPRPQPPLQVIAAWSKSASTLVPQQLPSATAPPSTTLMPVVRPVITSSEPLPQDSDKACRQSGPPGSLACQQHYDDQRKNANPALKPPAQQQQVLPTPESARSHVLDHLFVPPERPPASPNLMPVQPITTSREPVLQQAPPTAARPKITDRLEPSQHAPITQQSPPIAQKVVLYEEDPADPNGRRFVGFVIWRTVTATPAAGQQPQLAIRADIEVPERKLAVTWSLRRNTDKGLPATHVIEILFKLPADFPQGGISNVPGILMKQGEQTRGVPIAGLAVKVTPGFYLIGLSNQDADKERNLQLLKERGWVDIPVVYNNNGRAILAIEKGHPGERAFADAFTAWDQYAQDDAACRRSGLPGSVAYLACRTWHDEQHKNNPAQ